DDVEHAGQLEVAAHHAAYDDVLEIGRKGRQDGDLGDLLLDHARDHELTQHAFVRLLRTFLCVHGACHEHRARKRRTPKQCADDARGYSHFAPAPDSLGKTVESKISG